MSKPIAHFDQLYPGRFLRAGQFLGKQVTLTIKAVYHDDLEVADGKPIRDADGKMVKPTERKVVLAFAETPSELVLCKLNATCIAEMFGKAVPEWVGKRVTFWPTDTLMPMPTAKGDDRICIRVWGSPHLEREMTVEFAPPRRKPLRITLHPTGKQTAEPAPVEQPADDNPDHQGDAQ